LRNFLKKISMMKNGTWNLRSGTGCPSFGRKIWAGCKSFLKNSGKKIWAGCRSFGKNCGTETGIDCWTGWGNRIWSFWMNNSGWLMSGWMKGFGIYKSGWNLTVGRNGLRIDTGCVRYSGWSDSCRFWWFDCCYYMLKRYFDSYWMRNSVFEWRRCIVCYSMCFGLSRKCFP
jgi:hypothetical protein